MVRVVRHTKSYTQPYLRGHRAQHIFRELPGGLLAPQDYWGADEKLWFDSRDNVSFKTALGETIAESWAEHDNANTSIVATSVSDGRSPRYLSSDGDGTPSLEFRVGGSFAANYMNFDSNVTLTSDFTIWMFGTQETNSRVQSILSGDNGAGTDWRWQTRTSPAANGNMGMVPDGTSYTQLGTGPDSTWTLWKWAYESSTGDCYGCTDDGTDTISNRTITISGDIIERISRSSEEFRGKVKFLFGVQGLFTDSDSGHNYMVDYTASQWPDLVTY